jgi:GxxExxY protein
VEVLEGKRHLTTNEITGAVISAAMKVHSFLGPGLLESTYEACLVQELRLAGFEVRTQVPLPVVYGTVKLEIGYRIDLLVEGRVIVEIKSVEAVAPVHHAQVLSYLKLSGCGVGLLINFNTVHLRDGIKRFVMGDEWRN